MGTSTHCPTQTPSEDSIVPIGLITQKSYFVRSARVMLDADLARLYGVAAKNLNKAVKLHYDTTTTYPRPETPRLYGPNGKVPDWRTPVCSLRFHGARHCHAGNPRGVAPKIWTRWRSGTTGDFRLFSQLFAQLLETPVPAKKPIGFHAKLELTAKSAQTPKKKHK